MRISRWLKVSGAVTIGAAVSLPFLPEFPAFLAIVALGLAGPVFFVSLVRLLFGGLLGRVGSRLFVSFLLIGVVPLPFLMGLAYSVTYVFTGQLALRRVERALHEKNVRIADLSRRLAASGAASAPDPRAQLESLLPTDADRQAFPGLSLAYQGPAGPPRGAGEIDAALVLPRAWIRPGSLEFVTRVKDRLLLGSVTRNGSGTWLLYVPLKDGLRERLQTETGVGIQYGRTGLDSDAAVQQPRRGIFFQTGKSGIKVTTGNDEKIGEPAATGEAIDASPIAPTPGHQESGPFRGPYLHWAGPMPLPLLDWETGAHVDERRLVIVVNSSIARELGELFGHVRIGGRGLDTAKIVLWVIKGLVIVVASVYLVASLIAFFLVLRIARATRRLSLGFAAIEKGDFTYRGVLKGRDQLAELIQGFNRMAAHLDASVKERADREALKRELQLARELQQRLLPRAGVDYPGFEVAVEFRPAAAIGGDFYDLQPGPDRGLTVVLADVSGHGLSTGIVMASAKASLSAFSARGEDAPALLSYLDLELKRTTDDRTFVTLGHLHFDRTAGTAEFTNAGQLYPYRVEQGGLVSALENPARPLGVSLPASFRTVSAPFAPGDLWVFLSDGVIEARSPEGAEFGFERLERILAGAAGQSAARLRDEILTAWKEFTRHDEPEDDLTLLVLRVLE